MTVNQPLALLRTRNTFIAKTSQGCKGPILRMKRNNPKGKSMIFFEKKKEKKSKIKNKRTKPSLL